MWQEHTACSRPETVVYRSSAIRLYAFRKIKKELLWIFAAVTLQFKSEDSTHLLVDIDIEKQLTLISPAEHKYMLSDKHTFGWMNEREWKVVASNCDKTKTQYHVQAGIIDHLFTFVSLLFGKCVTLFTLPVLRSCYSMVPQRETGWSATPGGGREHNGAKRRSYPWYWHTGKCF